MKLSRDDILAVIEKIQYFYRLKDEIRYDDTRDAQDATESVAEHSWGMAIIATYFLPLEDPAGKLDRAKVFEMIAWHDISEVETGDVVSFHKTTAQSEAEVQAAIDVAGNAPAVMREHVVSLVTEYEHLSSPEAKFVKAIDKIEPIFHLLNEKGKETMLRLKTKRPHHEDIRAKHLQDFPHMLAFHELTLDVFAERGQFVE